MDNDDDRRHVMAIPNMTLWVRLAKSFYKKSKFKI